MIKLVDILKEIGDSTNIKPYYFKIVIDDENQRKYNFETDTTPPTRYEVVIDEVEPNDPFSDEPLRADIKFGVTNEEDTIDYNKVTNKGELFRVMATIVDILKKDLSHHKYINHISFDSSKRQGRDINSNARTNLYIKFIKSQFPKANIKAHDGKILAKLNVK